MHRSPAGGLGRGADTTEALELRRALAALPASLLGLRDRALLLAGWAGAFRRSSLVSLDVDDLAFGADGVALTIRRDKTDQEGHGRVVAVPFGSAAEVCPVRSLRAWLDAAGVTEGAVFRSVDRHGRVSPARLSDRAVALVVKRAVASIGGEAASFAGHSLRAGFATAAASRRRRGTLRALWKEPVERSGRGGSCSGCHVATRTWINVDPAPRGKARHARNSAVSRAVAPSTPRRGAARSRPQRRAASASRAPGAAQRSSRAIAMSRSRSTWAPPCGAIGGSLRRRQVDQS
jgi:Phage integrase family